jgi:membrane associated rhomboid family serine protease
MSAMEQIQLTLPSPRKLFTPVVTAVIVLMIIGFTLVHHATEFTVSNLAINPQTFLPLKLWQLITYSFINPCPWNLVFNGMVVLFIGSAIEREWQSRSFLLLWLIVCITCGTLWLLVNLILGLNYLGMGTGACAYGLIAAFGLLFRRKRFFAFFWTVEAQYLALILIGIGMVVGIARPITWIWVGGAAVAYIYIKLLWSGISSGARIRKRSVQNKQSGFVDID